MLRSVVLPGSAVRLVAGPPLVAFGEGSAGNALSRTLQSTRGSGNLFCQFTILAPAGILKEQSALFVLELLNLSTSKLLNF